MHPAGASYVQSTTGTAARVFRSDQCGGSNVVVVKIGRNGPGMKITGGVDGVVGCTKTSGVDVDVVVVRLGLVGSGGDVVLVVVVVGAAVTSGAGSVVVVRRGGRVVCVGAT